MVTPFEEPPPEPPQSRRARWAVPLVLAAAALGGVVFGIAVLNGDDDPAPVATSSPATTEPSSSTVTTPPPSSGTEATETTKATGTVAVPVYYLGDTENGLRLYREFTRVSDDGDRVKAALTAMFTRHPDDADYTSLWHRATAVRSVQTVGDVVTVDLSAAALDGHSGAEGESMSLQQLVHTATGAAPGVRGVRLLVEGKAVPDLWGHVEVGTDVLTRRPQVDVLAPVWITEPADGAQVGREVRFRGAATVFEATVSWEVVQDGRVVKQGFSTATEGAPGRGDWEASVRLSPGSYVLRAFESSAKDGRPMFVDDKDIIVR